MTEHGPRMWAHTTTQSLSRWLVAVLVMMTAASPGACVTLPLAQKLSYYLTPLGKVSQVSHVKQQLHLQPAAQKPCHIIQEERKQGTVPSCTLAKFVKEEPL